MIKALIFKEWLKIRWVVLAILCIFLLVLAKIVLTNAYDMRFYEARTYWYSVIFRQYLFYNWLIYMPSLAGILLAIAQFFPEINESRLKLTLHLPMKENIILTVMIFFGFTVLLLIYFCVYVFLSLVVITHFPWEVLGSVWITSLPWFVAGIIFYFAVTAIFVEPLWWKRIALIVVFMLFISIFFLERGYNNYASSLPLFLVPALSFPFYVFISVFRFRQGVIK